MPTAMQMFKRIQQFGLGFVILVSLLLSACENPEADNAAINRISERYYSELKAARSTTRSNVSNHLSKLADIRFQLVDLEVGTACIGKKQSMLGAFKFAESSVTMLQYSFTPADSLELPLDMLKSKIDLDCPIFPKPEKQQ